MSGLLQDEPPQPDCCDKTTVPRVSPDEPRGGGEPLQGLTLASHGVLEEAQKRGRLKCLRCGGSRMFFCYTCCLLVGVTPKEIPSVKVCKSLELVWRFTDKDPYRFMLFWKNCPLCTWIDPDVMLVWQCWHAVSFLLLSSLWRLTSSSIPTRRMEKAQQSMPKSLRLVMSRYTHTPAYLTMRKTRWVFSLSHSNALVYSTFFLLS